MPLRRIALSACPCGDPRGTPPPKRNKPFMGPCKVPKGTNTLDSARRPHKNNRMGEARRMSMSVRRLLGVWLTCSSPPSVRHLQYCIIPANTLIFVGIGHQAAFPHWVTEFSGKSAYRRARKCAGLRLGSSSRDLEL